MAVEDLKGAVSVGGLGAASDEEDSDVFAVEDLEEFSIEEGLGGVLAAEESLEDLSSEGDLGDVLAAENFGTVTADGGCGDASTGEDFGGATVEEGCGDASHEEVFRATLEVQSWLVGTVVLEGCVSPSPPARL